MINLYISSECDGLARINSNALYSTAHILKAQLDSFERCQIEFYPNQTNCLPIVTQLYFKTKLLCDNPFVDIIKYDGENYEIIFNNNVILPPPSYEVIFSAIIGEINISVVKTVSFFIMLQGKGKALNKTVDAELKNIEVCEITIQSAPHIVLTANSDSGDFLFIANLDFDIAFMGENAVLTPDQEITARVYHNDMRKHITEKTYSFAQGEYKLANTQVINDEEYLPKTAHPLLLQYHFLESVICGAERECLGYLTEDLREQTDFRSIREFLLPIYDIKQNIYTQNNRENLFLITRNANGIMANLLHCEIKEGKIADITIE